MTQAKVTLNELMTAVRELTFDRFIIPAIALKAIGEDYSIQVDKTWTPPIAEEPTEIIKGRLLIKKNVEETEQEIVSVPFNVYKTMEELMNKLIEENIILAYTPYFKSTEPSSALIQISKDLATDITLFRRYFFSDEDVLEMIYWYYWKVLDIKDVELTDEVIGKLQRPSERHLSIWVSYHIVEKRRMYENAAENIGQSFTDGSDYMGSAISTAPSSITTSIGSVFNITEDASRGYFYEDFNRVGSDNVWGDRYSFWYKLMLYLRQLLEETFGDFSLRKDNVIPGYISLARELDFRSYYDSYPFTLSPLSRGILSKTP